MYVCVHHGKRTIGQKDCAWGERGRYVNAQAFSLLPASMLRCVWGGKGGLWRHHSSVHNRKSTDLYCAPWGCDVHQQATMCTIFHFWLKNVNTRIWNPFHAKVPFKWICISDRPHFLSMTIWSNNDWTPAGLAGPYSERLGHTQKCWAWLKLVGPYSKVCAILEYGAAGWVILKILEIQNVPDYFRIHSWCVHYLPLSGGGIRIGHVCLSVCLSVFQHSHGGMWSKACTCILKAWKVTEVIEPDWWVHCGKKGLSG